MRGTPLALLAAQCNKLSSMSPPPLADAAVGKGFHPWKKSGGQQQQQQCQQSVIGESTEGSRRLSSGSQQQQQQPDSPAQPASTAASSSTAPTTVTTAASSYSPAPQYGTLISQIKMLYIILQTALGQYFCFLFEF